MPAEPVSRPWRRFVRFSVRGMIVLVLVIGAAMGWVVRSAHIQRDAVAAIEKAEGDILWDWEWSNGKAIPGGRPWAPRWLVDLVGVDYFGQVTAVWLHWPSAPKDPAIAHVGRLTQLQELHFDASSVSDADLAHLKGLTSLASVELSGSQVSDAGMVHLKGLTKLSELKLGGTRVSDPGLVNLEGLTNLAGLNLDGTQVSDVGLVHLKGLTKLSTLCLHGTQVTEAGRRALQQALPSLTIMR